MLIATARKISQCCPTKCIQLVAIVKQKGREEVIAAHSFRNIVPIMLSYSKKIKEMKVQCKTKCTASYRFTARPFFGWKKKWRIRQFRLTQNNCKLSMKWDRFRIYKIQTSLILSSALTIYLHTAIFMTKGFEQREQYKLLLKWLYNICHSYWPLPPSVMVIF